MEVDKVADMASDKKMTDMLLHMVADKEVDKVADMEVDNDMVANMESTKVATINKEVTTISNELATITKEVPTITNGLATITRLF